MTLFRCVFHDTFQNPSIHHHPHLSIITPISPLFLTSLWMSSTVSFSWGRMKGSSNTFPRGVSQTTTFSYIINDTHGSMQIEINIKVTAQNYSYFAFGTKGSTACAILFQKLCSCENVCVYGCLKCGGCDHSIMHMDGRLEHCLVCFVHCIWAVLCIALCVQ